eukprot:5520324-Pleurochrysis_carterae.AAC.5
MARGTGLHAHGQRGLRQAVEDQEGAARNSICHTLRNHFVHFAHQYPILPDMSPNHRLARAALAAHSPLQADAPAY